MSSRTVRISRLPTTEPNKFVDVEVSYDQGGPDYFGASGNTTRPRGYSLHVQPITKQEWGFSWEGFTGLRRFLEETKRFSAKRLQQLASTVDPSDVVKAVCTRQGITLKEVAHAQ